MQVTHNALQHYASRLVAQRDAAQVLSLLFNTVCMTITIQSEQDFCGSATSLLHAHVLESALKLLFEPDAAFVQMQRVEFQYLVQYCF